MKISEDTVSILNNFSSIQGSIVINPGSEITTIAVGKNILAKATVDETFPKNFGIYELSQFLGAISLLEDPVFEFDDEYVDVISGKQKIRYGYTEPHLIETPPQNEIILPSADLEFVLTQNNLKAIRKAAGVLNLPHVSFQTNPFTATVSDKAKGSSNSFDIDLKAQDAAGFGVEVKEDFCATFIVDNLKLFLGDYDVKISSQGIGHFIHKEIELEYWVSSEAAYSTVTS